VGAVIPCPPEPPSGPPCSFVTTPAPCFVEALARLRARSCILDGEAVACGDDAIAVFELIRDWRNGDTAFLYAFDLIELNGNDFRRNPLEVRKATLASLLAKAALGLRLNEHIEADGPTVFAHVCAFDLSGPSPPPPHAAPLRMPSSPILPRPNRNPCSPTGPALRAANLDAPLGEAQMRLVGST
jgi:ATP dependent DNA ligase-like protein